MELFFTSDLHFGHANIIRYDDRPFASVGDMDNTIISNWNKKVSSNDKVYILGDVSWYDATRSAEILNELNGRKILITGNHDKNIGSISRQCFEYVAPYEELHLPGNDHLVLCHYPITFFNRHHYGAYMLYGHVHNSHEWNFVKNYQRELHELDIKCNMCNVGCMLWDYEPVTFKEIDARLNVWGCA